MIQATRERVREPVECSHGKDTIEGNGSSRINPFDKLLANPGQLLVKCQDGQEDRGGSFYQAGRASGLDDMVSPTVAGQVLCSSAYARPVWRQASVRSIIIRSSVVTLSKEGVMSPGSSTSKLTINY